ncbi:RdRP-domain-containing protein [Pleomassaria siparia CBS 279.74]|uniref:RNA-dependent RNA polymerase n=1 Tax=Pleomassaria siparia CBS 279.74 TaxID=1314801 RepID=A0A6G1K292_9PLEO|nr:RdRP-domain-containing protein [Pleomassaria siparia CBS 279.74]
MDIFVRGISAYSLEKELNSCIKPHLYQLDIYNYYFQKIKGKPCAILTIADIGKATNFLRRHGFLLDPLPGQKPALPIFCRRKMLIFAPSKNAPKDVDIRSLILDEKVRLERLQHAQPDGHQRTQRIFTTLEAHCGYWSNSGSQLIFSSQYVDERNGQLLFGENSIVLLLKPSSTENCEHRIDIAYHTIESVVLGHQSDLSVTFAMQYPPKFFELPDLSDQLAFMGLGGTPQRQPPKTRFEALALEHSRVGGSCFVYRVKLHPSENMSVVSNLLKAHRKMPPHVSMMTPIDMPTSTYKTQLDRLALAFRDQSIPFGVKFQIHRLATNAYLPPWLATQLLGPAGDLCRTYGPAVVSEGIRRFANSLDYAGPGVDGRSFQLKQLLANLKEKVETFKVEYSLLDIQSKHKHLVLVHHVTITPAGIYLGGPNLEVSNRVIRQYEANSDHFIRVTFADEDGANLHYDWKTSNERIYSTRYQKALRETIEIAGRSYRFLGFSHSSLRSQTCWFCAPFVQDKTIILAPVIIARLGNFSAIRSPAKCAARIGQAFSDTSGFVKVTAGNKSFMPDVERNGRVFSDGCGTISLELLKKVWMNWAASRNFHPTVLQIRFQGVKGLVSLDTRLQGEQLRIRNSMQKFEGSPSWDMEMCGANFKRLDCYLNRQYIKILEDLGVPIGVFLNLQRERVKELKMMTNSSINASHLLESNRVGTSAHLPTLISILGYIGVEFQDDVFLWGVVQVTMLSLLRQIKYRSRILLDNGVTLHGIMDETGYLKEGQIYCVFEQRSGKGRRSSLKGKRVVITRAPALHPGDIQIVEAVDVPKDSPLNDLNNCVVFSQHGSRDLPSCLSGGDLDGDLYNVIWDKNLIPNMTYEPADYPRLAPLDIGRAVTVEDMSDFLLTFMKTDRLGQISNMHLQFADRYDEGVLHPTCVKLAQLASTAVDYSKTGIAVDITQIPRYDHTKPDFMAPGPRVFIEDNKAVVAERVYENDEEDVVSALDEETRKPRYYESHKTLGVLFRDIDERQFLDDAERHGRQRSSAPKADSMMRRVLAYVKKEAILVQWTNYVPLARELRETYEFNMADSMSNASPNLSQPVSEVEVFSGQIVGSNGFQSKRSREYMMAMRDDFDRHVTHTVESIRTDDNGNTDEALARAIACLSVGVEEEGLHVRKVGYLKSWKYIAAAVCLEELERESVYGVLRKIV